MNHTHWISLCLACILVPCLTVGSRWYRLVCAILICYHMHYAIAR